MKAQCIYTVFYRNISTNPVYVSDLAVPKRYAFYLLPLIFTGLLHIFFFLLNEVSPNSGISQFLLLGSVSWSYE